MSDQTPTLRIVCWKCGQPIEDFQHQTPWLRGRHAFEAAVLRRGEPDVEVGDE